MSVRLSSDPKLTVRGGKARMLCHPAHRVSEDRKMKPLEERLRNFFPWSFALRFCTSFYQGVGPVSPPLESGTLRPVTCFDQ